MTCWRDLKQSDWIVCPVSGLPEQVITARRGAAGRWLVRTDRHDHNRSAGDDVTLAASPRSTGKEHSP